MPGPAGAALRFATAALLAVLLAAGAGPVQAEAGCFADYKASRPGKPLRLHYGVMALPKTACADPARARRIIARRLDAAGWRLLNVVSLSTRPPRPRQKANAGKFYLRY